MEILLLEPFLAGSHATWAQEYQQFSSHRVKILGLSGRYWKWRMHGAAVTLARIFRESGYQPDLILASDMLDLSTFLALTRDLTHGIKTVLYFHENQLTYPRSARDTDIQQQRDNHYAFINYTSALAADQVCFNSAYHQTSFLKALDQLLSRFPDHAEKENVEAIRSKSQVLYQGMHLTALDAYRPVEPPSEGPPLILWNHRWEHDKHPEAFFEALFRLQAEDIPFEVAILGQAYAKQPPIFEQAQSKLGDRVVHWGYADEETYAQWLWRAEVLPVTSVHDFFGRSVVEAIYCGCAPLLPHRLAYPEHIPQDLQEAYLYADSESFYPRLKSYLLSHRPPDSQLQDHVRTYDWTKQVILYDEHFSI